MDSGFVLLRHGGFPPFKVLTMIIDMLLFGWGRRELNPHGSQSQCGALPIELRPTHRGDKESSVTRHYVDTFSIRPELAGRVGFEPTHLLIENQAA